MQNYNPAICPPADIWLEEDEDHRINMVVDFHSAQGIELPDEMLHALIHVIVENQIALGINSVLEAETRLQRQGLDRHETVHAIGAVLSGQLHGALTKSTEFNDAKYKSRLNKLTAKRWKKGKW